MIKYKSPREIALMRESGRIVAEALELVNSLVRPGITTAFLDREVEKFVLGRKGTLMFKGYKGFPANICASVNEEVVHGIPGPRELMEGDILKVDVGVKHGNYVGDAAWTFPVGRVSDNARKLMEVGRGALELAIETIGPFVKLSTVSEAIETFVHGYGYSVVEKYVGHGIGTEMHEDPQVPNFVARPRREFEVLMRPGIVVAIEPMVNEGTYDVETLGNGWTVVTKDRRLSVHFEHTVAVTESGREILTRP
jgi:methionyl aminopeptidase